MNTVNSEEIHKFSHNDWWNYNSLESKMLHRLNILRMEFILSLVEIKERSILDVGCGGGIASESLAMCGGNVTAIDASKQAIDCAIEHAKKGGLIGGELAYKMKVGIHARTKEQMSEDGKMGGSISGKKNYENGIGLASITKEKRKEIVVKTNSQKWMCLETDYITTSGPLTTYQRKRGIETSKRVRIS